MKIRSACVDDLDGVLVIWQTSRSPKRVNVLIADTDPGAADLWIGLGYEHQSWVKRYRRDL